MGPQPGSGVCKGCGAGGALLAGGGGVGCFAVVFAFGVFRRGGCVVSVSLSEDVELVSLGGVVLYVYWSGGRCA